MHVLLDGELIRLKANTVVFDVVGRTHWLAGRPEGAALLSVLERP